MLVFAFTGVANAVTYLSFQMRGKAYYVVLALLFFFVTFRWDVGCDWGSYLNQSNGFRNWGFSDALARQESGYWVLVALLHRLGLEYPAINVLAGLSFFGGLHAIARRQPDPLLYLSLSFPILMTGIAMSATRQGLAMGFVCLAFNAFSDKRPYKFALLILAASQFHRSAYAFFVFLPLLLNLGRQVKIVGILLALPLIYLLAASEGAERYAGLYVGSEAMDAAGGPFRALLLLLTGLAYMFLLKDRWQKFSSEDFELINTMNPVLMAMFPISLISSVAGDRFGYYLAPIAYIIQAKSYLIIDRKNALAAFWLPVFIGGVVLFTYLQFSWIFNSCYLPYQTWWSDAAYGQ